jgi:hypothetical protein
MFELQNSEDEAKDIENEQFDRKKVHKHDKTEETKVAPKKVKEPKPKRIDCLP